MYEHNVIIVVEDEFGCQNYTAKVHKPSMWHLFETIGGMMELDIMKRLRETRGLLHRYTSIKGSS